MGVTEKKLGRLARLRTDTRALVIAAHATVFTGVPVLLYLLQDAPRRSVLKEGIAVLTLVALSLLLGQFYLARSNAALTRHLRAPSWQQIHKVAGYGAISVLFLHPALIVLPRVFEGGVRPWDAFVTMVTTLNNLGLVLGLVAWGLMVTLGMTAWARMRLLRRFATKYRGWRLFHGTLAGAFVTTALWHAITLGRHTGWAFGVFLTGAALIGTAFLIRQYRAENAPRNLPRKPKGM